MIIKSLEYETILIDSRSFRKGILLQLTSSDGRIAFGEVSPLPGYSRETLQEAEKQIQGLIRKIKALWWSPSTLSLLETLGLYPSVYFGLESALQDLIAPQLNVPPPKRYALLLGSKEEILMRAKEAKKEGFSQAKVKLGHFSVSTAIEIASELVPLFQLRVDLNRKWKLSETKAFCSHFSKEDFLYIEEPVSDLSELIDCSFPFALDETVKEASSLSHYLQHPFLRALIIKPTIHYPIARFLSLGSPIILTSSFEGPIGIRQIEHLVHRLALQENYHGLDTLRYLETYEFEPSLPYRALASKGA